MIPPYFFTETTETEIFQINWNAIFYINYLIISLLEEKKAFPFQLFQLFQLFFHPNLSTFLRFWLDLVVYACKFSHQLYCSTNYLTFQLNYKISSSAFNLFICALHDNKSTEIL